MDPNARRLEGAFGADDERGDSPMICAARCAALASPEAPANDKNAVAVHSTLQQYIDREAERRARVIEAANEAQRLEDQRVYREQLARDGAKRKARRRRLRLEAQQRRSLPPVKALRTATDSAEKECDDEQQCSTSYSNNQNGALLLWEKKTVIPRPRSVVSSDRPRWVARQIYCTQQSQPQRTESEHDFMRQCTKLFDSLELERSRRLSMRPTATAPANAGRVDRHGVLPCDVRPETASF
ncbi:unnamed protein product [Phytophthora fragariaefolia]|uniref:Unnamed protein product n=1 Tax=Phytophthora fragariaefolia TaxID=1490495 RepID=A0A9W7CQM4_9STRA|nr:unnamed protein product [Phytophthora fragariaefolia]